MRVGSVQWKTRPRGGHRYLRPAQTSRWSHDHVRLSRADPPLDASRRHFRALRSADSKTRKPGCHSLMLPFSLSGLLSEAA
jgi:hypothetical protein